MLTRIKEKRPEWASKVQDILQHAQRRGMQEDAKFFQAILSLLEGGSPSLPPDHPYHPALLAILDGIAGKKTNQDPQNHEKQALPPGVPSDFMDLL